MRAMGMLALQRRNRGDWERTGGGRTAGVLCERDGASANSGHGDRAPQYRAQASCTHAPSLCLLPVPSHSSPSFQDSRSHFAALLCAAHCSPSLASVSCASSSLMSRKSGSGVDRPPSSARLRDHRSSSPTPKEQSYSMHSETPEPLRLAPSKAGARADVSPAASRSSVALHSAIISHSWPDYLPLLACREYYFPRDTSTRVVDGDYHRMCAAGESCITVALCTFTEPASEVRETLKDLWRQEQVLKRHAAEFGIHVLLVLDGWSKAPRSLQQYVAGLFPSTCGLACATCSLSVTDLPQERKVKWSTDKLRGQRCVTSMAPVCVLIVRVIPCVPCVFLREDEVSKWCADSDRNPPHQLLHTHRAAAHAWRPAQQGRGVES
jgi:hypothetical protein